MGWALPNSAWSTTVQSGRLICSDGLIDLNLDSPGLCEIHRDGVVQVNPLFRNFEKDNTVTGYGISNPGRLYQQILDWQNGTTSPAEKEGALSPRVLGFYSTLVLEAAEKSLTEGQPGGQGATVGAPVDLKQLAGNELGRAAAEYGLAP
jgi:hypothetical protein